VLLYEADIRHYGTAFIRKAQHLILWLPLAPLGERGLGGEGVEVKRRRTTRTAGRDESNLEFAKTQREFSNEFADKVWYWLRNRKIHDAKFRREYPIPPYTADFCCVELKLIIEVDGSDHLSEAGLKRDRKRDQFLAGQGFTVLRIPGYEVLREDERAKKKIEGFVEEVRRARDSGGEVGG
jgi:very-short-patch-repair endonuclease